MKNINHNQDLCAKEFGICNDKFEEVNARVLYPPTIMYKDAVHVAKGVWRPGRSFDNPSNVIARDNSWTVVNFSKTRSNDVQNLVDRFAREG